MWLSFEKNKKIPSAQQKVCPCCFLGTSVIVAQEADDCHHHSPHLVKGGGSGVSVGREMRSSAFTAVSRVTVCHHQACRSGALTKTRPTS